jgi:hypothetical protein
MSLASSSSSAALVIRSAVRSSGATTAKRVVSIKRSHVFCKFNPDCFWVVGVTYPPIVLLPPCTIRSHHIALALALARNFA